MSTNVCVPDGVVCGIRREADAESRRHGRAKVTVGCVAHRRVVLYLLLVETCMH